MAAHLDQDELDRERVSAIALRLINLGWFRVGSERYAKESGTYGITTLTRRHVEVRGTRIRIAFRGKHAIQVRTELVDDELAAALRELLSLKGGARVFRYRSEGKLYNLTSPRLNDYVKLYLGPDFTAKDFRTWGGTLLAAVAFAERAAAGRVSGDDRRREARRGRSDAPCGPPARKYRRRSAAPHTSRRRSSTSISTDERSRISGPAICAWSAPGNSISMRKNRRSSACSGRGVFGRRALPRDFA